LISFSPEHPKRSITTNAIYLLFGQYANRLILFAFYVVLARLQSDVFVGKYAIATTYAGFVFILASFGMERLVLREVSRRPENMVRLLATSFRSQILMWLIILPFACVIVLFLNYEKQIVNTIWLLMLWVPFSSLYTVVNAIHQGMERMDISSMLGIASALQLLTIGTLVLFLGGGLLWVAGVMIWERFSTTLLGIVLLRHCYASSSSGFGHKVFKTKSLLREAIPFAWLGLLGTMYQRIDILIMPMFVTEAQIGQYASAYRILEALLVIPAMIASAAFPAMARSARSSFSKYQEVAGKSLQYSLIASALVIVNLFVLAVPFITFIFGRQFTLAAYLLQILVWGMVFQSVNNTFGRCMIAADLEKYFFPLAAFALLSNIFLNLILLPRIGVAGAAIATIGSYAFSTLLHILVVLKHRVMPELRESMLTLMAFLLACVITLLAVWIKLGYRSAIFGVLSFFICLFLLKILSFQKVEMVILRLLSRRRQ